MNNLSLMLYLSDVIPSLGTFLGVLGTFGMIFTVAFFLLSFIWEACEREYIRNRTHGKEYDYSSTEKIAKYRSTLLKLFILPVIFVILSILIPGRQTIQLIAASEASSSIVNSKDGQEIIGDIKLILKNQLKQYLPKETKGE